MSFDIWLDCFKDGDDDLFSTNILKDAFTPFHVGSDGDSWILQFPGGGGCEIQIGNKAMVSGFGIIRPAGDGLYDAIYKIMRQTRTVLSWSFGGAAVADPAIIPHLPPELIESLGVPTVIHSGADIIKAIESS